MDTKKGPYSIIGFGGRDGLLLRQGLTAEEVEAEAENADVDEYLVHPPWRAKRKKPPERQKPGTKSYMVTSCRRLVFRQLLSFRWKHIPNAKELKDH